MFIENQRKGENRAIRSCFNVQKSRKFSNLMKKKNITTRILFLFPLRGKFFLKGRFMREGGEKGSHST